MRGVDRNHLDHLYADTSDPWNFAISSYEQSKFRATREALFGTHYRAVFELGCGNGQLAKNLVPIADLYVGMDSVERALDAARNTVPDGQFIKGFYPCELPDQDFDLLILSEILYFLDLDGIGRLAHEIMARWPRSEIVCVNWLGPSGNPLQGDEAFCMLTSVINTHSFSCVAETGSYRIDRGLSKVLL